MDTEKPLLQMETSSLKAQTERLPAIEVKKDKEKSCFKKSSNALEKRKISFPKLKTDEIPHQKAGAGEPGDPLTECSNGKTKPVSYTSFKELDIKQSKLLAFKADSKVIGISKCEVGFKVPSSEVSFTSEGDVEEETLEESNALKRWKYWLKDKIHMQKVLSKKLGRDPCDLQIQESDKSRAIYEDKLLLTYSQIPKPDKWRGHPFFWKLQPRIGPQNVPEDCEIPQYIAAETKLEKGCLPEMEFIGFPEVIKKEKNLICKVENMSLERREKMPYRKEQINRFKDQRRKMKPHNVLLDQLAVVGVKITEKGESSECENSQSIPEIIVTEENSDSLDFRQSIFCLVIDGEEIKYKLGTENCQDPDKVFTWQVDFGTNKIGSLVEKVLRIENRGTMTVAYDWISKKSDQKGNLNLLKRKLHEPCFFFNKNSGLFLPGQIYDLKFYHHSELPGFRKELWYLKTTPPLWQNKEMGTVVLSAVAADEFSYEKQAVELFLRNRVRDTVVKFAIEVIFYKVFNSSEGLCGIEYRSFFNEKELFEYHNPKHYYHSSIVNEIHELFDEIPSKNQPEWDFSLSSFVAVVKTSFNNNQKQSSLLQKVALNSRKLLRPNYVRVKKFNKHEMAYDIISKMVTLIEEDHIYVRNLFFQNKEHSSSLSSKTEETSEEEFNVISVLFELKPVDFIFFQTIIYTKVHQRLCEAVEGIVGMIETKKLLEPWRQNSGVVPSRRKLDIQSKMWRYEKMLTGTGCKRGV